MTPKMTIKRYAPLSEKKWSIDQHGSRVAKLYTCYGLIEVYSFPGDDKQGAFTSLETYAYPHVYHATLPRHYHDRWLMRLAMDFGCRVYNAAKREASK